MNYVSKQIIQNDSIIDNIFGCNLSCDCMRTCCDSILTIHSSASITSWSEHVAMSGVVGPPILLQEFMKSSVRKSKRSQSSCL